MSTEIVPVLVVLFILYFLPFVLFTVATRQVLRQTFLFGVPSSVWLLIAAVSGVISLWLSVRAYNQNGWVGILLIWGIVAALLRKK